MLIRDKLCESITRTVVQSLSDEQLLLFGGGAGGGGGGVGVACQELHQLCGSVG